jgi:WhiB family redox-sensing transcriptional regulator
MTTVDVNIAPWLLEAACRGSLDMFEDSWGEAGLKRRGRRAAALAVCRYCPVRRECGEAALASVDAGVPLYGIWCGVEFTDVTPCRQDPLVARLRAIVEAERDRNA